MADETEGAEAPERPEIQRSETAEPGATGAAAAVKSWSEAVAAAARAALLLLAVSAVTILVATSVQRERDRSTITVEIDPNAEKVLGDLGTDLDLRATLIDDFNANIGSIEAFIRGTLFNDVSLRGDVAPISLKPFGVDLTTDTIGRLYRDLVGLPDPLRIRVGLLCPAGGCEPAKAAQPERALTLLVELQGPKRVRRLTFPVPPTNPGLRRGIRQAMLSASQTLLEQTDPLLASLLYFNLPQTTIFYDETQRYGRLATAATAGVGRSAGAAGKDARAAQGCMADIVFHGSAWLRSSDYEDLDAVEGVAARPDVDPTCAYSALSTAAQFRLQAVFCSDDEAEQKSQVELVRRDLDAMTPASPDAPQLERDEIGARRFNLALTIAELEAARKHGTRRAACLDEVAQWDGRLASFDLAPLTARAEEMRKEFGPRRHASQTHPLIYSLTFAFEVMPRAAIVERLAWYQTVGELAQDYVIGDPAPRVLHGDVGRAQREAGDAAVDSLRLSDGEFADMVKRLGWDAATTKASTRDLAIQLYEDAATSFDNAATSPGASSLSEPPVDIEPLTEAGDAYAAAGLTIAAEATYARAVESFIEADEPTSEIASLTRAAAHWLAFSPTLACGKAAAAARIDDPWRQIWAKLGASERHDACAAAARDPLPARTYGLLAFIQPWVQATLAQCPEPKLREGGYQIESGVDRLRCLRVADAAERNAISAGQTQVSVDLAIRSAIAAP